MQFFYLLTIENLKKICKSTRHEALSLHISANFNLPKCQKNDMILYISSLDFGES